MGYIVHLTTILHRLFMSRTDVSPDCVQLIIGELVRTGRKDSIHSDIRRFLTANPAHTGEYLGKDVFMEKIRDLIPLALKS
jgi:hypothetical protein